MQAGQKVFIESTAEGREGAFYDLCRQSQALVEAGKQLSPLDYKFHFFPWFRDPKYRLESAGVVLSDEEHMYFEKLESETGIAIDDAQRAWLRQKSRRARRGHVQGVPVHAGGSLRRLDRGRLLGA